MYSVIIKDKETIKALTGEDRMLVIVQIDDKIKKAKISTADYMKKKIIDYAFAKSMIK